MGKKKRKVRLFSIIASFVMIFTLVTPGVTSAQSSTKASHGQNDPKHQLQHKVSSKLIEQFEEEEKIRFLIKFSKTTDTLQVAEEARNRSLSANYSAMQQEHTQRSAVISALKKTALESQQDVLDFLEEAEQKGIAEDVHAYHIVNGVAVTATKEVAEKLAAFQEVEKILPNEQRDLIRATDTELQMQQNEATDVEWNIERIGAPEVWDMGIDGQGTVVASIDSGADWEHPALRDQYRGYDFVTGKVDHTYSFFDPVNEQEAPYDDDGHGTHVTGTMVGAEPNGSNHIGVAPGAKWIAVQAFTPAGAYDDDLLAAAEWILAPGGDVTKAPDVVNNSWGGGAGLDEWYRDAVTAWRAADIFPAFAAGNTTFSNPGGPGSVAVPANYPESFAVGSTNIDDDLSSFSLEGPSPYDEVKPDISAPGEGIRSSLPGGGYGGMSGTSMASPAVAGVVALLRSANAELGVNELEDILMEMADAEAGRDESFPASPNNGYGYGILDAYATVSSIVSGLGTVKGQVLQKGEDSEAPTYEHEAPAEVYSNKDLVLTIDATDDVTVTSVELHYGDKVVEAVRTAGSLQFGEYTATIPAHNVKEGIFTYHWVINDYGGNEVTSDTYEISVFPGITVGYTEDFEGENEPDGWDKTGVNNVWERGVPTSGPNEAVSGENVYATNLDGDYPVGMDAMLLMPPIDMPEDGEIYLQFESWHKFELGVFGFDIGQLMVSTDLDNWSIMRNYYGSGTSWTSEEYDLSDYAGERIYIGFNMSTSTGITHPGWYIDDVALSGTPLSGSSVNVESIVNTQDLPSSVKDEFEKMKREEGSSIKMQLSTEKVKKDVSEESQFSGLPVSAQVSVLETNRSIRTNPLDGSFQFMHEAGEYTVLAEAYGFASKEQNVVVETDESVTTDFVLDELPAGTINGVITNERTGEAVEGATVLLVEDANIDPIKSDAGGNFEITGYEGGYTLSVITPGYYSKNVEVTIDGDTTLDIAMKPFYSVPGGEISYDDGTMERARAFDNGDKWAVRMSLPEGRESAIVTDGVFQFQGTNWPNPGGTAFAVEVWSAGDDNMPDERLAGPIEAEAIRDLDQWTVIDLRDEGIQVTGDFFMVYIQTGEVPFVPGLATDLDGPNAERSYKEAGEGWLEAPEAEGNYMIRARIDYEVEAPTITSPEDGLVTDEAEVTVTGTATPHTAVEVLQNGETAGTVEIGEDGSFAIDTELEEGANEFIAVTYVDGEDAADSAPVTVVLEAKPSAPVIENVTPSEDVELETGESVMIQFESEPGLRTSFTVHMALTDSDLMTPKTIELPMMETTPGNYLGYFTVPRNTYADGALIEVKAIDSLKNETREYAEGKLYIN